ncbi:MAG: hypothetical protein L6R19_20810 [Alphaproteobacteria bacterium]|nr:hypothetical protein [Alphaproteobacteria bacterium]
MKTAGILVLLLAAVGAGPAAAEEPMIHHRNPERYQAPPPLPQPAMPQPPKAAAQKPGSPDVLEDENEERRSGLRPLKQKPLEPGAKPEMVGKEKLWTTRDPPNQRGPFAFLGNRIGDPLESVFPDPDEKDEFGMALCRETAGLPGFLDCTDDSISSLVNGVRSLRYRGVEVSYLNYRYLDRKLVGFQMGFPSENFGKLEDALEKQYGAPHTKEDSIWKIRPGYELKVRTIAWNTPHGTMSMKSRAEATEAGMLSLIEPKAEEHYNALRYKLMVSRGFNVPKGGAKPGEEGGGDKKPAGDEPADAAAKDDRKPAAAAPSAKRLQME